MIELLTQAKTILIGTALVAALAAVGYVSHKLIVLEKDHKISELQVQITQLNANNEILKSNLVTYQEAALQNEKTINDLRARLAEQAQQATTLTAQIQRLNRDKQEYMSIFKRHDLANLARVKPGLIENRINSGTSAVIDQIEKDSLPK